MFGCALSARTQFTFVFAWCVAPRFGWKTQMFKREYAMQILLYICFCFSSKFFPDAHLITIITFVFMSTHSFGPKRMNSCARKFATSGAECFCFKDIGADRLAQFRRKLCVQQDESVHLVFVVIDPRRPATCNYHTEPSLAKTIYGMKTQIHYQRCRH